MHKITVEDEKHGTFTVTSGAYDATMERHLPSSPRMLRRYVEEATGMDYSDVEDVSTFIAIIADMDHNRDGDPLSVDANFGPRIPSHAAFLLGILADD